LKKIIVSVSNDLSSDQRVKKVCQSLIEMGFTLVLLGRILPDSIDLSDRNYLSKRFKLWFNIGPLFYANLNIRLFFYLLLNKSDLLLANDLDTLPANFLASKIKRIPLVYDTHEYFTEVPELQGRLAKKIWESIEGYIFPKLKHVITVNDSIASIYQQKYGNTIHVIKNIPNRLTQPITTTKSWNKLFNQQKYIILQGAGINVDRGGEELMEAMKFVNNCHLLIVGGGDVIPKLKLQAQHLWLQSKVTFLPKQNREKLMELTAGAALGLSLDKDTNLNYRYSLPNKLFDYIQAGIPILASNLPEVAAVIQQYGVGMLIENHSPKEIANKIELMLAQDFKANNQAALRKAAAELVWENQENILKDLYLPFLK